MRWRLANKKNYTNTCQVVNGKKQCEVYCDGRDTFDQKKKNKKTKKGYLIIFKH